MSNNQTLTKKQRSALYSIQKIIDQSGVSPTYKELGVELGTKSDISITRLLNKLEETGYIEREKNKARAIRITDKAYKECPELNLEKYKESARDNFTQTSKGELTIRQKELLKKLSKFNSKFVNIYSGALYIISEKKSTDWIAQSAHSFREIFMIMANEAKTLLSDQQAKREDAFPTSLGNYNDPTGGVTDLKDLTRETIYDEWNRFHRKFVEIAHHKIDISPDAYLSLVSEYEEFLMKYAFAHQASIYGLIDEEVKMGPAKAKSEDIRRLITRNLSAVRYFYNNIDAKWLEFVFNNGFLFPLQMSGEYLVKVACEVPEEVMEIIKNYESKYTIISENRYYRNYFIEATLNMPSKIATELVDIIIKGRWSKGKGRESDFWPSDMVKLLKKYLIDKEFDSILKLMDDLLDVKLEKANSISLRDITADIDKYYYQEIVEIIHSIPAEKLSPFLALIINKLRRASELLYGELSGNNSKDSSYIWFHFIHENARLNAADVCEILIIHIKKLLVKYFEFLTKKELASDELVRESEKLLGTEKNYYAFQMIKIFLYRKFSSVFKDKIQWTIIEKFDIYELNEEYDYLVSENFNVIDEPFKKKYFELVESGPKDENDKDYIRRWKIGKYALVSKHLDANNRKRYKDLLNGDKEPEVLHKGFSVTSWVGPTTPKKEQELEQMTIDELVEFFISWVPKGDRHDDSRLGLAREFSKLIVKKPEYFSANAQKFINPDIWPVYIHEYFMGLREAVKDKTKKINWEEVIKLIHSLVLKSKEGKLLNVDFTEDGFNLDWDPVFQYAAALIEDGLNTDAIQLEDRERVWEIISYICENKEPTLEYEKEYGGENMDLFSLSINTARGVAFNALFAYIFWTDRNLKLKENKLSRIVNEAKIVLENHLSKDVEPGNVIFSVYGRFFPWLYLYDKEWIQDKINIIFPLNEKERRHAAWDTYLLNGIFDEVFKGLEEQYKKAISELPQKLPEKRSRLDSNERLVAHMMIAYVYKIIELKDQLFQDLFLKLNDELKGEAVSFAGRSYIMEGQKKKDKPDMKRLKKFWEWRLEQSSSIKELENFGWWIKANVFDNEWMLKMLIDTLVKTNGFIDADFHVLKTLGELVDIHSKLVAKALLAFVKSRHGAYGPVGYDRGDVKKIVTHLIDVKDEEVKADVDDIIDQLLRLGHTEYLELKKKTHGSNDVHVI
ncbi:MAG: hypothetical protein WC456_04125 [Patescibacteria group bacterium]